MRKLFIYMKFNFGSHKHRLLRLTENYCYFIHIKLVILKNLLNPFVLHFSHTWRPY